MADGEGDGGEEEAEVCGVGVGEFRGGGRGGMGRWGGLVSEGGTWVRIVRVWLGRGEGVVFVAGFAFLETAVMVWASWLLRYLTWGSLVGYDTLCLVPG